MNRLPSIIHDARMRSAIRALPLLLLIACASQVVIPANKYGLRIVPDLASYERIARNHPEKRLLDLQSLGIAVDVRYATADNFMKKPLYHVAKAYLRAPAAHALQQVQLELAKSGLGVKVFDAYRPYRVTEAMWEPIRNPHYVADPAKGSRHNRGAAVDLTLIKLDSGAELDMPTGYDDFTDRAAHAFSDLPAEALRNRAQLREVMERNGFQPLPSEWWHYDFSGWERFELMNVPLDALH